MGRGLSPLQKRILELAEQNPCGEVSAPEVLMDYYGFPRDRTGALNFDRRRIGKRYFSGTAAVSRAFGRLVDRGLAERLIGGIRIPRGNFPKP